MMNPLFIIADGAHARFVERSRETGDFVTLGELDGSERLSTLRAELRASPAGRSQESMSPTRRSVGPTDFVRHAKEDFVRDAVDLALKTHSDRARHGVVLVAPARLVGAMRERLGGHTKSVRLLRKDLTKVPDHELDAWLAPFVDTIQT
jgi:protein required for attachment to host cells